MEYKSESAEACEQHQIEAFWRKCGSSGDWLYFRPREFAHGGRFDRSPRRRRITGLCAKRPFAPRIYFTDDGLAKAVSAQRFRSGDFAPGDAGVSFYMDVICPLLAIALLVTAKKKSGMLQKSCRP
jgi:hypothetical protein